MDNNFNNTNAGDDERTVLIQPDMNGNPQVVAPQGMPVQPQFGQTPQGMPGQPQFGQAPQGIPGQPQFGQAPQEIPVQPQFGQAPQGIPGQPQFGQAPQGMPGQPQFGQAPQGIPGQPQFGQASQGIPGQPQYGQAPQGIPGQPMFGQTSQGMPGAQPQFGGTPQQMSLNKGSNNNSPKKGNGSKIAIIIVCVLIAIALIVGLVLILGGGDDKKKDKEDKTTEATTEVTTEATTETTTEESTEATTETTTEATTESTTEGTTEAVESVGLIDVSSYGFTTNDWKSLEFALDGKVYTWPISYAQLKADGYSVDSSIEAETLDSMYYSFSEWAYKDGENAFFVSFKNYTDSSKVVADCDIQSVSFTSGYDDVYTVVLCNGITLGTSYEDVISVMGEPTDEYVSEDSEYGYRTADYDVTDDIYCNSINFTFMEGVVTDIEITNED